MAYLLALDQGASSSRSSAELESQWRLDRVFKPAISRDQAQALMQGWETAVGQVKPV